MTPGERYPSAPSSWPPSPNDSSVALTPPLTAPAPAATLLAGVDPKYHFKNVKSTDSNVNSLKKLLI